MRVAAQQTRLTGSLSRHAAEQRLEAARGQLALEARIIDEEDLVCTNSAIVAPSDRSSFIAVVEAFAPSQNKNAN